MAKHLRAGKRAENLATDYLQRGGYTIRDRNFRTGAAEVDIVAQKHQTLYFIEIKAKSHWFFGPPEERIVTKKIKLYQQASIIYQEEEKWFGEIQFDMISITFFP